MEVEMLPRRGAAEWPTSAGRSRPGRTTDPMEKGTVDVAALAERVAGMEQAVVITLESVVAVIATADADLSEVMCCLVRDRLQEWARGQRSTHATACADALSLAADRLHQEAQRRRSAAR